MSLDEVMKILDEKADGNTLYTYIGNNQIKEAVDYISKLCNCDEVIAKAALINVKTDYYDPIFSVPSDLSSAEIAHINAEELERQRKPKCIYCGSTNLKRISGLSKAGSVALWGVFAMGKVNKQFHCNNCGADF